MKKFTFRVDVLSDSSVDVDGVREALSQAVNGIGSYTAATATGSEDLTDQGLKVFAKRVLGISLATPKVKKAKPVAETVEA
ncbi:hypothetical protein EB118_19755 [bacterium]|nr:hypothetical protein [Actinomycetota bacterium]NDG32298.1 hypothetical protein [bacterium]